MAEILPVTSMIAQAYEPLRQNRWILAWQGLDAWTLKTFSRPNLSFGEVAVDYINTKRYFQGKFDWQTVEMTLYNPILPNAAEKVMDWVRLGYENISGRAGYKEYYTAKDFTLNMLDPVGAIVESWVYINLFPVSVNFNGLDMSSAEVQMINITCRFDAAIMQF